MRGRDTREAFVRRGGRLHGPTGRSSGRAKQSVVRHVGRARVSQIRGDPALPHMRAIAAKNELRAAVLSGNGRGRCQGAASEGWRS